MLLSKEKAKYYEQEMQFSLNNVFILDKKKKKSKWYLHLCISINLETTWHFFFFLLQL